MRRRIEEVFATNGFVVERLVKNFAQTQSLIRQAKLEQVVASEGRFLIGDAPAQSLKAGHSGVGPMGGVPWAEATTVTIPLGPRHAIALGGTDGYIELDERQVEVAKPGSGCQRTGAHHVATRCQPGVVR